MRKNYTLLGFYFTVFTLFAALLTPAMAQTVLISPTGNGGFESGTTFAANGWLGPTIPTGAAVNANRWVVDNAATAGFSGARCAYVSNTATSPAPHTYGTGAARTTHFWRDVTVPAGQSQITLSFNWMGNGESIYDYLRVWLVPTTFTPTVNNPITTTGTAPTGRIQQGATYYNLQTTWTSASLTLPVAYAGTTFRLVFEWTNDASSGTNPPAAIDNISLISQVPVAPANDECATAIALPVTTSCAYLNYTNAFATASSGIPAPGCANYLGGDVWFTATVPANGILTVDMQTGVMLDSGMAFYTGSCAGLTLLECDDDDSPNGAMSYITRSGLTPGSTIYIRVWEFGNDNNGSFGICASTLPNCAQTPSGLTVNSTTATTASFSWTAASPAPPNGYEYFYNTTGTAPVAGTTPSGSVGAGVTTASLGGLTANTTYYFWVRSVCGVDRSAWVAGGSFYTGYCISNATATTYYINNFATTGGTTNITNNGSGASAGGYGNFTAMTVTQAQGGTINFSTAFFNGTYTYGFNIWVDWNNDMDFNDPGEQVYASGGYVTGATGSFTVPVGALAGNHRMRIKADYLATNPPACGTSGTSETEDYTLNVAVLPCPTYVTGLSTGTVTQTSAVITWTAASPAPANGYQYYYNTTGTAPVAGTTPSGSVGAGITSVTIASLTPNTTYYVWVRTNCNGTDQGIWVGAVSFYTGYCAATSTGSTYYINSFTTTGGILNISNSASGFSAGGYGNFTGMTVSQTAGSSFNFSSVYYDAVSYTYGFNIWVDWNNDMDFNDPGEKVYASGSYNTNNSGTITIPTGTPVGNYRMRIRANYLATDPAACGSISSGETEDYTLAVTNPLPCSGNPTSLSANILSASSVSVSWIEAWPIPANGYQYFFSTASTTPATGATPSGSTGFGVLSNTFTGLTPGITYYVWVRSNCGGALGLGAWVGPLAFVIPTCGVGNSTGTTTLGCHTILSGGIGQNGGDAPPLTCGGPTCTTLEATYLQVPAPTSYTVSSILYNPPYQFNCLKNPVSVNNDDVWSPMVNLPFNFCFYGNTYNRCLISSNGVLTFDTVNNTAGGYSGWSFATNIPSATLFPNSIFGVYHDIDPRVGGEVGWELITLNSGCRALVAAWNNIPMYSCNGLIASAMIVLYENTNVIEIYIKNKPVCAAWNDGNAIAGIQNASGTNAVVPPGRNGLDANWTATNEAWRFSPSGASTATVRWYQGSGVAGPFVGTGDTISVCPSSTTTYTAQVTYDLCNSGRSVIVTDETVVTVNANKTWNGSVSTNWNTPGNWTPTGVPTNVNCVLIPNGTPNCVISGSAFAAYAYNLTVQNGGVLRVDPTNNNITVTDVVNVNTGGTFNLMNSAGLIQINNVANTGNINMTRISAPMYRYDYTYWGTPMTQGSNYTLGMLSPNTQPDKYYSWIPYIGSSYGTWQQESTATVMQPAKGYIVRAPQSFSTNIGTKVPYTAVFTGTPNNGNVSIPVLFGTMAGPTYNDQYNLLANPYPSSISAAAFLNNANNANVIDGTIYFWTHNSAPSAATPDPFYNDFIYNYTGSDYASWNKVGPVASAAATGGATPNGYIAAGQAFFTRSLNYPSGSAQFNNGMRSAAYSNSQFFRPAADGGPVVDEEPDFEKHRVWLNLVGDSTFSQILVAYAEGATNGWERGYDGIRFNYLATTNLYSVTDADMLVIQARGLPFDDADQVPLGFNSMTAGNYTLRIDHFDGLFEGQNVYLEDKLLNTVHDLKQSPYAFTTAAGNFTDRFVLRYNLYSALGTTHVNANDLTAYLNAGKIHVAAQQAIKRIEVFEISGKLVKTFAPEDLPKQFEDEFVFAQGVYMARITLDDGTTATQKLMNK